MYKRILHILCVSLLYLPASASSNELLDTIEDFHMGAVKGLASTVQGAATLVTDEPVLKELTQAAAQIAPNTSSPAHTIGEAVGANISVIGPATVATEAHMLYKMRQRLKEQSKVLDQTKTDLDRTKIDLDNTKSDLVKVQEETVKDGKVMDSVQPILDVIKANPEIKKLIQQQLKEQIK